MTINYNKLWKLLIDKNIKKTELCNLAGISTNAMAKLGKNESVQLEILMKICDYLQCDLEDILTLEKDKEIKKYKRGKLNDSKYGFFS